MTRTVEQIILEIERRMFEIQNQLDKERSAIEHDTFCSLNGAQYELNFLLDWIKSEEEKSEK